MSKAVKERKRQQRAVKTIERSVQAKLDADRKRMGETEWNVRQSLKQLIASRPMGNY